MKIRTLATLAVGYVIGAGLRPEHIEQAVRARGLSSERDSSPSSPDDPEPQWPDPTFTL